MPYNNKFALVQFFDVLKHHFWHPFWNPILAPDLPKKQQDEPKRAIRSFKDQKTAFSKPLKNLQFFNIFGSRDLPREPQETQEDSQEATKELQNLKKNTKDLKDKLTSRVENALSRRSRFNKLLKPFLEPTFGLFFDHFLTNFWCHVENHLENPV